MTDEEKKLVQDEIDRLAAKKKYEVVRYNELHDCYEMHEFMIREQKLSRPTPPGEF